MSGWPLPFLGTAITIRLSEIGVSKSVLGLLLFLHIPYGIKFFWGPFLEKIKLPSFCLSLGRRRACFIAILLLLACQFVLFSFTTEPFFFLFLPFFLLISYALSGGLYMGSIAYEIENVPKESYGTGSSLAVTGYRLGLLGASVCSLYAAEGFGWQAPYLLGAFGLFLGAFLFFISTVASSMENKEQKEPFIWREVFSLKAVFLEPVKDFLAKPDAFLLSLLLIFYKGGDNFLEGLLYPFYLERGFLKTEIAHVVKILGMAMTFFGAFTGGVLFKKLGAYKALFFCAFLHALSHVLFPFIHKNEEGISFSFYWIVALNHFISGMKITVWIAFLWKIVSPKYASSQYALFWSFFTLKGAVFSACGGFLAHAVSWEIFFLMGGIISFFPCMILFYFQWHKNRIHSFVSKKGFLYDEGRITKKNSVS